MTKIKEFFFICGPIINLDMIWRTSIVNDIPDIGATPFGKMVSYIPIRDQKLIARRKAGVRQIVFTRGYI
jgi:hypothetical protein